MMDAGPFRGPLAAALPETPWVELLRPAATALPLAPASDRSVWDHADPATVAALTARAEAERGTAWPQPLASQAARVHRDGDREIWETPAFERQFRLTRAAAMAALTRSGDWIDEVADGIVLVCEQSSWCWPAHDDTFERHGAVLATTTDPYLDLGAGEAVAQLAWIDHLLGAELDEHYPGLRARIRLEARDRVFTPFIARRDWHWIGLDGRVHNWNPWIHGNVLTAALRLLDGPGDAELRGEVVGLCVEGLDRYVAALPDDGAIDEGYEYWWNGACRALEALDVLAHATSDRADLAASVGSLRETVAFPHRMHLGDDWYVNLADGQARPVEPKNWHSLYRAAVRIGDGAARDHATAQRGRHDTAASERSGAGRLLRAMSDPDWLAARPGTSPLPRTVWLPSVDVLLARERTGSAAGLTLTVKGGHNGENHNHNDVGSFIVASDGVPVLVDAGRPTYTKQTFGPDRYDIWTMQSHWHSLPVVNGRGQQPGAAFAAREVTVTADPPTLALDIAAAYDEPGIATLHRRVALDKGTVALHDQWDGPDAADASITEHLLVAGDVELVADGARVRPLAGATPVRLRWTPGLAAHLEVRVLDDPMLTTVWGDRLTRIVIAVAAGGEFDLTVERDDEIAEDAE